MIFNRYLEKLTGSKVKIKILRALCRFENKSFTSRELAANIQVSHTAVLKSLPDLQEMNIINRHNHGNSHVISINEESHLYRQLKEMFNFEDNSLNSLKKEIIEMLPKAKKIALFGSISQKKEKPDSDVDILIIAKDKQETELIIAEKQEKFTKKFGNVISAQIMNEAEFSKKKNTPFIKDLLKNHIMLKGERL